MNEKDKDPGGITSFAIKNNVTVLVIVALLIVSGISSYFSLPKQQDPGFTIRAAVVTTVFPGANPLRVEQLVTDRIEEVLQEIPEIDYVESESRTGISIVTVHFLEKYTDMRPLFDKIRRKMDDLEDDGTLPDEAGNPNVDDEYGDVFGILYALQGDGFTDAELKEIADEVRNDLLKLDDVAKVEIHGEQDEVIYVEYNGARLQEMGLTPNTLSDSLANANILQSGGDIRIGQERIELEPTGNYETLEALRKTVIQLPNNKGVAYLGDFTTITRGYVEPAESMVRYNGQQGLLLAISLREGGDILVLGQELDRVIPEIEAGYPWGLTLSKVFSQPALVEDSVSNFMSNLFQAIAIVAIVMFLFLGFRTGTIVASLIPTTIVMTFVCMTFFEITINEISLAALIIALGLLVDNAIVMAEAISIRRENGEDKIMAAIRAGKEMSIPLMISSLTTAAAFLCIYLSESAIGEYASDIFRVVTIALISSWLLGMTFIPIMTTMVMKIQPKDQNSKNGEPKNPYSGLMYRIYRMVLFPCLRLKITPLVIIVGLFFIALWALALVPVVFIPEKTDPIINAKFNMPRGTDIAVTETIIKDLEQFMIKNFSAQEKQDGIIDILSFVGVGTPRYVLAIDTDQEDTQTAAMIINLTDYLIIPEIVSKVKDYAANKYPDLEVKMRKLENGTPIDYPIEVRISGNDIPTLYKTINPIKQKLLSTPGVLDVSDDWGPRSKKLVIRVNQDRARRAGVTNSDVALSLKTGLSGLEMTEFRENNDIIPVTLRSVAADRQDLGKLDGIIVYAQGSDTSVPLKQVADIELEWQNAVINRRDRTRMIIVRTQHYPGITATEVADVFTPWLEEQYKTWPKGYTYEMGGEMETSSDASAAIGAKLPISGMLILLLLVAQFNSIRKTVIILLTIPLGMIGITFGLILTNSIFGFFTILGIISLSGIIINNAIVLIDRINIEQENGRAPGDAIIEACQQRLRPILLTTTTTVGGMLPLWISHDPMFETMAVTVIFGLLFATMLTLVVVPILYSLFFKVNFDHLA
ncbi:MAG: efflux RND transporter permease subunit [Verrucomicrobiota bacterium]